ncbi:MAG: hypothetical protein WC895_04895 [Candidatus Shapirobacteria bacterium]|jgi:hypothetical protein
MKSTIGICTSLMSASLLCAIVGPRVFGTAGRAWFILAFIYAFGYLSRAAWRHVTHEHYSGTDTLRSILRIGAVNLLFGFFLALTGIWIKNENENFWDLIVFWALIILDIILFIIVARQRETFTRPKGKYFVFTTVVENSRPKQYNVGIGAYLESRGGTLQELAILRAYLRWIYPKIKPYHSANIQLVVGDNKDDRRLFVSHRVITEAPTELIDQLSRRGFIENWPPNRTLQ